MDRFIFAGDLTEEQAVEKLTKYMPDYIIRLGMRAYGKETCFNIDNYFYGPISFYLDAPKFYTQVFLEDLDMTPTHKIIDFSYCSISSTPKSEEDRKCVIFYDNDLFIFKHNQYQPVVLVKTVSEKVLTVLKAGLKPIVREHLIGRHVVVAEGDNLKVGSILLSKEEVNSIIEVWKNEGPGS